MEEEEEQHLASCVGLAQHVFLPEVAMRGQDDHIEHVWGSGQEL